jgi:hypothetical protein
VTVIHMQGMTRLAALLALALGACARAPRAELHTGADALPGAWQRIGGHGARIALHHVDGGAIAASVSCDVVDQDAPLDVLVNHLLLQLEAPIERSREQLVIDGRGALRVRLGVRVDGVPVELDLVVLKKDGCVVDAQLIADATRVGARRPDFDRFVAGLAVTRRPR